MTTGMSGTGKQRYAAVVLYRPEFENAATAEFFQRAARGKTILYRIGEWTKDFNGKPLDANAALPAPMKGAVDIMTCAREVIAKLTEAGVQPQTPASGMFPKWNGQGRESADMPASGHTRLTDGTVILVAGEKDRTGDPIQETIEVHGHKVTFDAAGVAAVRLSEDGKLEAHGGRRVEAFQGWSSRDQAGSTCGRCALARPEGHVAGRSAGVRRRCARGSRRTHEQLAATGTAAPAQQRLNTKGKHRMNPSMLRNICLVLVLMLNTSSLSAEEQTIASRDSIQIRLSGPCGAGDRVLVLDQRRQGAGELQAIPRSRSLNTRPSISSRSSIRIGYRSMADKDVMMDSGRRRPMPGRRASGLCLNLGFCCPFTKAYPKETAPNGPSGELRILPARARWRWRPATRRDGITCREALRGRARP